MSSNPTPSLFDEGLARRLDTLLTSVGALLLLGIELAALADGAPVRGLAYIEVFSLSLLAFAGLLRFARSPWLAMLSTALVSVLSLRVSWFRNDLPGELFPLALGLLTGLFLWRSSLPRPVATALIPTALSLAVLMTFELGALSAIALYALIIASARSSATSAPAGRAGWRGDDRWWFVCVSSLVLMLGVGVYHQLREPLELWSRSLFNVMLLGGLVTSLIWLLAWSMLLRGLDGVRHSTFWSAIRLSVGIQVVVVVLLIGTQLVGLAAGHDRWPPYIAAAHSFAFVLLIRMTPLAVLSILRGLVSGRRSRLFWPWFFIASEGLSLALRTTQQALTLDRTATVAVSLHGLSLVIGIVAMWGLMRSLRDELSDTSIADTFSSDPETPEPRRA